jgi:hypothetical protein
MLLDPATFACDESISAARSWAILSNQDKQTYLNLRSKFVQPARPHQKDRNSIVFRSEVHSIIDYIDSSVPGREHRSIICGLLVADPFICVNNRQLKHLIGRCKSSINGSFQQIGYMAVKTKDKARQCTKVLIPSLATDPGQLRQWTVRFNRSFADIGFTSCELPLVTDDDLYEDSNGCEVGEPFTLPQKHLVFDIPERQPLAKVLERSSGPRLATLEPPEMALFPVPGAEFGEEARSMPRSKSEGWWDSFGFGSTESDLLSEFWAL